MVDITSFPIPTTPLADVVSGKNKIINGNFDIWQRGTSTATVGYLADRWYNNTTGGALTATRQNFTLGQTDVPNNPKYFHRHNRTTAATAANNPMLQRIEGVETLAGTTATLSFYAKGDAAKDFNIAVAQVFGTGGSPSTAVSLSLIPFSVTTTWQKFEITVAIPSITGKTLGTAGNDYLQVAFQETTGFSTFTLDVSQVQLEAGDTATLFEQRPIGQELMLCQRYYDAGLFRVRAYGVAGHVMAVAHHYKQTMRALPTLSMSVEGSSNVSGVGSADIGVTGFSPQGTIVATGSGTYIGTYTADAEL